MSKSSWRGPVWLMSGVAVTLITTVVFSGLTGSAAPGADESTFVPVAPCRLFDYRPAPDTVGARSAAIGAEETVTQQVTGAVGNCTIPSTASAVAMNVTAVLPTAASFLTIFPADLVTPPTASSLNWLPNQGATPNKVDVKLSPTGAIKLYNKYGSVNVLADVVGYYTTTGIADLEGRLAALESSQPTAASAHRDALDGAAGTFPIILSVSVEAPTAGSIQIVGTAYLYGDSGSLSTCRLSRGAGVITSSEFEDTDRPFVMSANLNNHCATSGALTVGPGTHVINLVARIPTSGGIEDASLDAVFIPGGTVVDFGTAAVPFAAPALAESIPLPAPGAED